MKRALLWGSVAAFAVVLLCSAAPARAFAAFTPDDVTSEFSSAEISELFYQVASLDACDFVMRDCGKSSTKYLRVREKYRARYERLVGDDSVDLASEAGEDPQVDLPGNPLVELSTTSTPPWNDLLLLDIAGDWGYGNGSGFMVSGNVAVTAAHCVYQEGAFAGSVRAQSSHTVSGFNYAYANASYLMVQKEWVENAVAGASTNDLDLEHDFAIMVFEDAPEGTSGASGGTSFFWLESITVGESLGLSINCAGYAEREGYSGIRAWKSERTGGISLLDLSGLGGNVFQMSVSTVKGMSGGPVYSLDSGEYKVVGIDSYDKDVSPLGFNYACRITERLQVIATWAAHGGYANIAPSGGGGSPSTGVADSSEAGLVFDVARWAADRDVAPADVPAALAAAREANPDVAAWLCVPGAGVAGPVCRREGDDSYYLTHGPDGAESVLGCAYVEQADAADFSDPVTVLYGHSFGLLPVALTGLHAFSDPGFFCAHDRFYVATADGRLLTYRVVEAALYKSLHLGGLVDESDPASVQAYLDPFADDDPSRFAGLRRPEALNASSDRILQLSTCTVPATEEGRWVVTGVLDSEEPLPEAWGGAAA